MTGNPPTCLCGECRKCKHRVHNRNSRARLAKQRGTLNRRLPIEPLLRIAPLSVLAAATNRQIYYYIERGTVGELLADRIAVALRYHPSEIWDTWFPEDEFEDVS